MAVYLIFSADRTYMYCYTFTVTVIEVFSTQRFKLTGEWGQGDHMFLYTVNLWTIMEITDI